MGAVMIICILQCWTLGMHKGHRRIYGLQISRHLISCHLGDILRFTDYEIRDS